MKRTWVVVTGAVLGVFVIIGMFSDAGGGTNGASTDAEPSPAPAASAPTTSAPTTSAPAPSAPAPSAPASKPSVKATSQAPSPSVKPTQAPKITPKPTVKPKPIVYKKLTARAWAKIAKDPDAHIGEAITVHGTVTQFDAATGTDTFRANMDGIKHRPSYGFVDYPTNTLLTNVSGDVSDLIEDDLFTARVLVLGSFSYDTQIGGTTTVPHLSVISLTKTGSVG
ncbi:hypothetical protein [Kribbella sp. NPDC023855]|uniref:hypothetical protein n=1 Tax=Kribbella sp. NPDC023855 TaxID=3154698 RepID=UPI0033E8D1CB